MKKRAGKVTIIMLKELFRKSRTLSVKQKVNYNTKYLWIRMYNTWMIAEKEGNHYLLCGIEEPVKIDKIDEIGNYVKR